jgi:hypothetical protein
MTDIQPNSYISLASPIATSNVIDVRTARSITLSIDADSWGTAVIELQWSLDGSNFHSFEGPQTFTSNRTGIRQIDVFNVTFLRLATTTADGSADSEADIYWKMGVIPVFPFERTHAGDVRVSALLHGVQLARGLIDGIFCVSQHGINTDIDIASDEVLWGGGGDYTGFLTSASSLEIVSSATTDDDGDIGAHTVRVFTLDSNWNLAEQTVTMNGQTAVALAGTHMRCYSIHVLTSGASGPNRGTIDVQVASGGAVLCRMQINEGESHQAIYTIPSSHTGYLTAWSFGNERDTAGALSIIEADILSQDENTTMGAGEGRLKI